MFDSVVRGTRTVLQRPELGFGLLGLAVVGVIVTIIREEKANR